MGALLQSRYLTDISIYLHVTPLPCRRDSAPLGGETMWPTLLGNWWIPWPHGSKSFLVIALCCANEKLPSSRRLMLSYACVCVHTTAFHVFCSYVLRWPTNIYTTHKRRMSDVSERLGPSREFRSHQFVQVGEPPFWCSKSDRGGLHSRQSLRCLTTLKPQ